MGNLVSNRSFNRNILSCTLVAFILGSVTPIYSVPKSPNANLNDVGFVMRIEKLADKAKKNFFERNGKKLTDVTFDIKREIEAYTGVKISIDQCLDTIERQANSKGQPVDKAHMKEMRKRLKSRERKENHKAIHAMTCFEYGISYNSEEASMLFDNEVKKDKKKEEEEEVVLPMRVTIGVTMALAGLFLVVIPIPVCKLTGTYMLEIGLGLLGDQAFIEWEEKDKDDKK